MYLVTLEEAKKHLNIESYFTDDDAYISQLIDIAFYSLKNRCNNITWTDASGSTGDKQYADYSYSGTTIPFVIKQAILLLVGNLYSNREPVAFSSPVVIPYTLEYLIAPYINYGPLPTTSSIDGGTSNDETIIDGGGASTTDTEFLDGGSA